MPALSIIIPTHRRPATLAECLRRLEKQTIAETLEVIVVSDGGDQQTAKLFQEFMGGSLEFAVKLLEVEECRQGKARNVGVQRASADVILFIGDDIFLEPDACETHVKAHSKLSAVSCLLSAVLGFTTWDPAVGITPVMRWLEQSGWQFGYHKIERYRSGVIPRPLQHLFTYTSNISVPTDIARRIPFREDVSLYGWEDTEWGMRLADDGVKLFYEPAARAFHHHRITLEDSLQRMETLGVSVVELTRVAHHLDRLPRGWKRLAYEVASLLPTMSGRHRSAFLKGIRRARGKG